jgi:hypothetical protein
MARRSSSRSTPFQRAHEEEFALKITARDLRGGVASVQCLLCVYKGKEEKAGAKRGRTGNVKSWTPPFRKELYIQHHSAQHPVAWAEYRGLTTEERCIFLSKRQQKIEQFLDLSKDILKF